MSFSPPSRDSRIEGPPVPFSSVKQQAMFRVEVRLSDEANLRDRMETMRTWLDHQRFEPAGFRHLTRDPHIVCRIDFSIEAEAVAFAEAFDGAVLTDNGTIL